MNSDYHCRIASITAMSVFALAFLTGCNRAPKDDAQGLERRTTIERKYVVADIIRSYDSPKSLPERVDEWIVCVTANIAPGTWGTNDFLIFADHHNESIVATCDYPTHDRILALLEEIRKMNKLK
jgi:hypothetical protein